MRHVLCLLGLAGLAGCFGYVKPSEGDKKLNTQNIGAGRFVEGAASDPAVKQAGKDVAENSTVLEENLIGKPEKPEPYSAEASEKARKQSEEEHSLPWWAGILTFLGGSGVMSLLVRFLPSVFGGPIGAVATAVMTGITKLRKGAEGRAVSSPDSPLPKAPPLDVTAILGTLKKELENAGVQKYAHKIIEKIEKRLGIDLKIKLND